MIVLSANIRYSRADDGANRWPLRRDLCLRILRSRRPDVVCFQELTDEQLDWFSRGMPEFAIAVTADRPLGGDPVNAIFYRRDRFLPKAAGAYWLSRTPHVAGSKSWGSDCVRMATWVRLASSAAEAPGELRIVNTHLDHISQRARVRQAARIAEDCSAYPPAYPQVLTGDFNCDSTNRAVRLLLRAGFRDTYETVHSTLDPMPTFHSFEGRAYRSRIGKMDWVMVRGDLAVRGAEIVMDSEGDRYPSDHFFVAADLAPRPAESR